MSEFNTQSPESAYGEASRNYLDNVIRVDYGSELQDQDVQFGDNYVVDPSEVTTYRNLQRMNGAVNSGEPESPKQQLYLESVQAEMAMRETYSSSISHEAITRAFDGVEADTDRAGLLASVAHDIQREVLAEAQQAAANGDTAHAAELTQSRNDLNTYVGVKDKESMGQKKRFDRNVRNDWLDGQDRDADFYDSTYSMQEIAAMDRAEAKYLPDMLERVAYKRETEAMKQQVARLNVNKARPKASAAQESAEDETARMRDVVNRLNVSTSRSEKAAGHEQLTDREKALKDWAEQTKQLAVTKDEASELEKKTRQERWAEQVVKERQQGIKDGPAAKQWAGHEQLDRAMHFEYDNPQDLETFMKFLGVDEQERAQTVAEATAGLARYKAETGLPYIDAGAALYRDEQNPSKIRVIIGGYGGNSRPRGVAKVFEASKSKTTIPEFPWIVAGRKKGYNL